MGCSPSKTDLFLNTAQNASASLEISIQDIKLDQQPFYDFLNELARNPNLQSFEIKNVEILGNFKKLITLTNTLRYKKTLNLLSLTNIPDLGPKKGKACYCLVSELPLLETLILKEVELNDSDSEYISRIIESNSKLKSLDLSGNIFEFKVNSILKSFHKNSKIERIFLEKINLNRDNIDILCYSLSNNVNLTELRLGGNYIGKGIFHFNELLKNTKKLETLSLSNCQISDVEFGTLMEILQTNQSLRHLYLNMNSITSIGRFVLKAFFEVNDHLSNIYLLMNPIQISDVNKEVKMKDLLKVIF